MKPEVVVLSEAKISSGIALSSTPLILAFVVVFAGFFGRGLEAGIYYGAFGPLIYVVFFGGLAYAFYEFTKIVRCRSHYLTYQNGYLHILEQKSVKVNDIRSLTIERKLLWESLVIKTAGGTTSRIRGYLLQRDLVEVQESIEALRNSDRPQP
ncbi:hypothetical protein [uncultured Erythrobacter sp.]|uniref:hypothetical protein n=1 Tax=uncultured Erythrobacter sp. TaxID=263913 RepID=UPI00262A4588|nr:hypothetical protein [uncultured Erythrobacter sp.]